MKYILAHDIGTSGNKAALFTVEGHLHKSETYHYATSYKPGGMVEQNPLDWWKAFCRTTQKLTEAIDPKDIAVISFSGQMMGCLCVDQKGRPLRSSLIYSDQRSVEQMEKLKSRLDPEWFYRTTGTRLNPSYTLEKLMWVADNQPGIYQSCHKTLQAKEFLAYRITGRMCTDFNDASGTSAFNILEKEWSQEILNAAGIEREKFPEALPSTTVIGDTGGPFLAEAGLPKGIPVVIGSGDGGAATVGAGSVSPGHTYNYIGSSSWISLSTEHPFYDARQSIFNWVHPVPGLYQPCGSMQTAGSSFEWFKKEVFKEERGTSRGEEKTVYDRMDEKLASVPPLANGVLFLPYLMGERTPWWDPDVKGAFLGIGLKTRNDHLLKAVVEGICYNLNIIKEIYQQEYDIQGMRVFGGMARSRQFLQTLSDITGLELTVPHGLEEATSMGAAVIGGVGAGLYRDFDVIADFIKTDKTICPNRERHRIYREYTSLLEEGYQSLKEINKVLV